MGHILLRWKSKVKNELNFSRSLDEKGGNKFNKPAATRKPFAMAHNDRSDIQRSLLQSKCETLQESHLGLEKRDTEKQRKKIWSDIEGDKKDSKESERDVRESKRNESRDVERDKRKGS